MPAPGIPRATYDLMVISFRDASSKAGGAQFLARPPYTYIAQQAGGVDWRTCKRAWLHGWTKMGMPGIRGVLLNEEVSARAERQRAEEERKKKAAADKEREAELHREELRKAAKDLAKMRAALGELGKNAVAGAGTLLKMAMNLQPGLDKITQDLTTDAKAGTLTRKEKIELIKASSVLVKNMGIMSKYAADLEERIMTSPSVPDFKEPTEDLPPAQLVAQMEEFLDAVRDADDLYESDDEGDSVH